MRGLLTKVIGHVHFSKEIIDAKTGEFSDDSVFEARINGISCHSLPLEINMGLNDGAT